MLLQLEGCRLAFAECPLLHRGTKQPLAFTSYIEPARLQGRDAMVVLGPVDMTFKF